MKKFFTQTLKILLFSLSIPTAIFLAIDQSKNVVDSRSVVIFLLTAVIIYFAQTFTLLNQETDDLNIDEKNKELKFYNIYNHYILPLSTVGCLFMLGLAVSTTIFVATLVFWAIFLFIFFVYLRRISSKPNNKELSKNHSLYDLNQIFFVFLVITIILNSIASDPYGSTLTIVTLFFPLFIISFVTILKTTLNKKVLVISIAVSAVVTLLLSIFNSFHILSVFSVIDSLFITLLFFLLLRSAEDFFMDSLNRSAIIYRFTSIAILVVGIVM